MNKRYIDFVPAKNTIPKGGIAKPKSIKVSAEKPAKKPVKKVVRKIPAANPLLDEEVVVEEIFAEREEPAKKAVKKAPKASNQPKFVKTDVKKRPLGAEKPAKTAVKAKPVTKPAATKPAVKPATVKPVAVAKRPAPLGQRAKFINTNKIEKRPLSAVAARKTPLIVPKVESEKPKKPAAPEKIISKPEKDSKAGLIIAIILTIILGAAAGTVAFLLLPK
ncbi:hypothetical protein IJI86_01315 [Candidatus Saccharibacteria bacterium]|nr:hypothetical protein [Candidatus Saccharibacteria bacterium]